MQICGDGIGKVRCYREYWDMEFIGGYDVRITYPYNMKYLFDEIEYKLRLETTLSQIKISNIAYFICGYWDEISETIKVIKWKK